MCIHSGRNSLNNLVKGRVKIKHSKRKEAEKLSPVDTSKNPRFAKTDKRWQVRNGFRGSRECIKISVSLPVVGRTEPSPGMDYSALLEGAPGSGEPAEVRQLHRVLQTVTDPI